MIFHKLFIAFVIGTAAELVPTDEGYFSSSALSPFFSRGRYERAKNSALDGEDALDFEDTFAPLMGLSQMMGELLNAFFPFHSDFDSDSVRIGSPNVTISEEACLMTIPLENAKNNNTAVTVRTGPGSILVEVSQMLNSAYGDEPSNTASEMGSDGARESPFRLRRGAIQSTMTVIRSFPAPENCNVTNTGAKATFDDETREIKLKFPVSKVSQGAPGEVHLEGEHEQVATGAEVKGNGVHDETPSEVIEAPPAVVARSVAEPQSWYRRLLSMVNSSKRRAPNPEVIVPFVRKDEF